MTYLIYGKRIKPWWNKQRRRWEDPDKTFRAIDYKGVRVNKLEDAASFAEKTDAQEYIAKHADPNRTEVVFEIRKARQMAKLSQVDVFRCDCCNKETIVNTHNIKITTQYCGSSEPVTLTPEKIKDIEITPNPINTIQLPYISRETIDIVHRGDMDFNVGAPQGKIANEVKTQEYHLCEDCMKNIEDDFTKLMNASAELQEKYFDSSFN